MDIRDTSAVLVEKLSKLRNLDLTREIHGAKLHKYQCKLLSSAAVDNLEQYVGFALPNDYREWLLTVGIGAGPDYGLLAPGAIIENIQDIEQQDGFGGDVEDVSHITEESIRIFLDKIVETELRIGRQLRNLSGHTITANSFRGALPISHQGCNGWSYLILSGRWRGFVFGECCDIIGKPGTAAAGFWPTGVREPGGQRTAPFTFLEWVEDWLDKSLNRLL